MPDSNQSQAIEKRVYSTTEAAIYLGLSPSLLSKARMDGERESRINPPPSYKMGSRKVVYYKEDLDYWLDQIKVSQEQGKEG